MEFNNVVKIRSRSHQWNERMWKGLFAPPELSISTNWQFYWQGSTVPPDRSRDSSRVTVSLPTLPWNDDEMLERSPCLWSGDPGGVERGSVIPGLADWSPRWQLQTEWEMSRCLAVVGSLHTNSSLAGRQGETVTRSVDFSIRNIN